MNLTEHFSMEEFITTQHRGIDNSLPDNLLDTARQTCEMLERIRTALAGLPIIVTSGFRCDELNRVIGSKPGSDHPKAMAVDFKCPEFGTPYAVCQQLAPMMDELGIGQMIYEFSSWIHVSTRKPDKAVNRILTISARGTETGIRKA